MWTRTGRSSAIIIGGLGGWSLALAMAAVPSPSPSAPAAPETGRAQASVPRSLPEAQNALQSHLQHCDTLMAVLHARRAMAFVEGGSEASAWQDMEVLVTQCHVTAAQLREQVEKLQAQQAGKATPTAPALPSAAQP